MAKELLSRGETDLVVNAAAGAIDVRRDGSSGTILHAHNLLHALLKLPRGKRPAEIRRFLDGLPLTNGVIPDDYAAVAGSLLPVVRGAADFGLYSLTIAHAGGEPMPKVATSSLVNDVVVALAIDMPESMSLVAEERFAEWGVSFEHALEQALQNLRGLPEHGGWKAISPGVWSGEWGDSYESSRILLPDLIRRLGIKDPVAMVSFRGAILVTSAHDARGIASMLTTVEQSIRNNNRWVSFRPAILQGTTWSTFVPPPELLERFRRLDFESAASSHAQQKEFLDKKFEAEVADVFVASYLAVTRDGALMTWATWTKGVTHALLPEVDAVFFGAPDSPDFTSFAVPWSDVCELVGHLMLATEWMPTRFSIHEFPSPGELDRLRAAALPRFG